MSSITVRVDLSASNDERGTGSVSLVQSVGGATIASATWDSEAGEITFLLDGASVVVTAPANDGSFHEVRLTVDGAGNAQWQLDGAAAAIQSVAFPPDASRLVLSGDFPNGPLPIPTFRFDNVLVTSP
jgi:dipeptidyl aminopeptidase/acylaminoacyl peptidase